MKGTGEYICENACDETDEESDDDEEINRCDECNIELDRIRDGSTDKNFRCNNCYWEDVGERGNLIFPDYRKCKKSIFKKKLS